MVRILVLLMLFAWPAVAEDRAALHLELVLDPRDEAPFEGEMILATIRGVYSGRITNEDLKLRPMTDFDWTRLAQDDWREQRVHGRAATVYERRIALYPRRAGALEVLPIAHELQLIGADGRRETVVVRSTPVRIEVRPRPAGAGDAWLPVRALELSESWSADPARLADGQNVVRRVVLRALGATPEMMPAQPPMREPWLITFAPPEQRDFQVVREGPVTTLVWTWTLRPITGEPGVLPGIAIPYYDTSDREARTATIPAARIGYASFATNAASGWSRDLGVGLPHLIAAAAAFLIVLVLALRDRPAFSATAARLRHGMRRRGDLRRLRRHAVKGETARFRSLAMRLLEGHTHSAGVEDQPFMRPVDASLFGPDGAEPAGDLWAVFLEVRRELSGRGDTPRAGAAQRGPRRD